MADLGITMDGSAYLSNQGRFAAGRPRGVVVHTLECDAKPHIAEELSARGGYLDNKGLAPQRMTDPTSIVRTIPDGTVGGHVGARGNPLYVGVEVSGRAGWSRSQWLDGGPAQAALSQSARAAAGLFIVYGHGYDEIRWLSGAQIKAGNVFGLLGHVDVSMFIGGTNHWDPGLSKDFPYEWYAAEVRRWFSIMNGTIKPPEDDMPLSNEDINKIVDGVWNKIVTQGDGVTDSQPAWAWLVQARNGVNELNDGRPEVLTGQTRTEALAQTRNDVSALSGK